MIKWYYVTAQKTHQEFSEEEVPNLLRSGAMASGTLIWNSTMTDWKAAGEVKPEWFSQSAAPSSPAAPTSSTAPQVTSVAPATTGTGGTAAMTPGAGTGSPPLIGNETDPLALSSLICGIVAVVLVAAGCAVFPCIGALGILAAIPAIVTGHMALAKIKNGTATPQGKGLAVGGLIMGYVTLGLFVVGFILAILGIGAFAAIGAAQNGGAAPVWQL